MARFLTVRVAVIALTAGWLVVPQGPICADVPEQAPPVAGQSVTVAPLDYQTLGFNQLSIAEISPATPTAGQIAQIRFIGVTRPTPAAAVARGFRADEQEQFMSFLRERVQFRIDGRPQLIQNLRAPGEFDEGVVMTGGSFTVKWPEQRGGVAALGFPATRVQTVQLLDGGRPAPNSEPKVVETRIPADAPSLLGLATLFVGFLVAAGWWLFTIGRRSQLALARSEPLPVLEDDPDSYRQPPPAPAAPVPDEPEARRETPLERPVPAVPERLAKAVCAGQAVLVLGTGASAQAGLPTAHSLQFGLIHRLEAQLPEPLTYFLHEPDPMREFSQLKVELGGYSKVMDAILGAVPRELVIEGIRREIGTGEGGSRFHSLVARLPWRGVVAMTWDRLAERVFTKERPHDLAPMQHYGPGDTGELASAMRAGAPLFLTPLGDLDKPHSLSLSMAELRRSLTRSPELQRSLVALLQSHSFLFVGHAVDSVESFLQAVAPELEVTDVRHYALLPHERTNAVWATTLGRFGVEILPYAADAQHKGVVEFVANLSDGVEAGRSKHPKGAGADQPAALSAEPIRALRLTNIGPFDKLELDFATNDAASPKDGSAARPWTVIFGGNGIGKSSILRAMALVLAGSNPSAGAAGRRLLKAGASDGMIEVQIGSHWLKTQLIRDRTAVEVISAQQTPVQNGSALVLGFSALRGARAADPGGPSTTDEARDPEPLDLVPLIDGAVDTRLADFKQWLLNLLVRAEDGSQARAVAMRDLLDKVIRDIVPGQIDALVPIDKKDFVIRVRTPEGDVPFDDLSQGMASIFNWVGILAQRLSDICPNSEAPNREPAIVLIDEVDAHLHPEWQRRLVELTRNHFPNVQVIATSHSPLLAGALRGKELVVLRRDSETGKVGRLESQVDLFGMPSQHILTSVIFDMETDRNPEVERLVREYFSIFQKAERTDEEEERLEDLEAEMARYRYGASYVTAAPHPEPSEEQIEALRKRLGPAGAAPSAAAEEEPAE